MKRNFHGAGVCLAKATVVGVMVVTLAACAAVVAGGAASSAVVATDSRTLGSVVEDQTIELRALEAFKADREIDTQAHINVISYNQIVLATGQAPAEEIHQRIVRALAAIQKVRHVYDEIQIAAPSSMATRSADSLLTAKVKTKLLTLKDFNGTRVKVVTENGVVYLMGLLTTSEADAVAALASQISGVQKVVKLFEHPVQR